MNFLGDSIENNFTGEVKVNGDLIVTDEIQTKNITVSDTATINTLISNIELEVKDPLITCGVDNTADNINLGLLEEYTNGGKKWSGIIRSKNDKKQYVLEGMTSKPLPSDNIPTTSVGKLGRVVAKSFEISGATNMDEVGFSGNVLDLTDNGILRLNGSGFDSKWEITNDNTQDDLIVNSLSSGQTEPLKIDGVSGRVEFPIGVKMAGYTMPNADGNVGEIMKTNGAGVITFQAEGGGTPDLQAVYDESTSPQIETDAVNPTVVIKKGTGGGSDILAIQNEAGVVKASFSDTGDLALIATDSKIMLKNSSAVDKWTIQNTESDSHSFELKNALGENVFNIQQDGTTTISPSDPDAKDFVIHDSGRVSIGTDLPLALLTLSNPTNTQLAAIEYGNVRSPATFDLYKARGTPAAPINISAGDYLFAMKGYGYFGGNFRQSAQFLLQTPEAPNGWTNSSRPSDFVFLTPSIGSITPTEKFRVSSDGFVTMGTETNNFTFPNLKGSIGQILQTDDTNGNLVWANLPAPPATSTLQEIYDASSVDQITTTISNPTLSIKDEQAGATLIVNNGTYDNIEIHKTGEIRCNSLSMANSTAVKKWDVSVNSDNLLIKKEGDVEEVFKINQTTKDITFRGGSSFLSATRFDTQDVYLQGLNLEENAIHGWNIKATGGDLVIKNQGGFINYSVSQIGDVAWSLQGATVMRIDAGVLKIGQTGTNYSMPNERGTNNQQLVTDAVGDVTWQSTSIGELAVSNNATVTGLAATDTYQVPVLATFDGKMVDFTSQVYQMTYTGTVAKTFKIHYVGNWLSSGNQDNEYRLAFFKNGVIHPTGQMSAVLDSSSVYPRNVGTSAYIDLAPSDVIDIRVKNVNSSQGLLIKDYNLMIHSI